MQVCLGIRETYLWVDSLCIIQDDPVIQKHQIDIMDTIYSQAVLTIVAAAGDHADSGLPGVSTWMRDVEKQIITIQGIEVSNVLPGLKDAVNLSVWNTRGWTYQERMFSRKCFFFTESQAIYACSEGVQYERKDRLPPTISTTERFRNAWNRPSSRSLSLLELFTQNVTEYTRRMLTSQTDILRAFQGVIGHMMRSYTRRFHYGLPEGCFENALLWQKAGRAERRLAHVTLPSWPWASVNGVIKYIFKEERLTPTSSAPIPAYWQNEHVPSFFEIDWLLSD